MTTIQQHPHIKKIVLFLFFAFCSFAFSINSPSHPWVLTGKGADSSVFQTVAMLMHKGYIPYKDTFDHKGPILYIINYIGYFINSSWGIWLIECIFLTITFLFMYKISKLFCNDLISLISLFFILPLLFTYYDSGNLTEEYAMLFIAISLFIFLDYFFNNFITNFRLIVCGCCFAIVFLLRINMVALWFIFCLAIFIICIYKKKYDILFKYILFFLLGLAIIFIPILIWLSLNNALLDFFNCYILFNLKYSGAASKINIFFVYVFFLLTSQMLISIATCIYCYTREKNYIYLIFTFYLLFSLYTTSISGRYYMHYGMINIPAIIFPISIFFNLIVNKIKLSNKILHILLTTCIIVFLCPLLIINSHFYSIRHEDKHSQTVISVCNIIKSNSLSNDRISVYGNWDSIYLLSDRLPASKYSYQFPIGIISPNIFDEYFNELKNTQPALIIIAPNKYNPTIENFLLQNNYKLLTTIPYENSNDSVLIYKKMTIK